MKRSNPSHLEFIGEAPVADSAMPRPSQKDIDKIRRQMAKATTIDPDLHMGGKAEEMSGIAWLQSENAKANDAREAHPAAIAADAPLRIIKRYANRKLYDTKSQRYVTLTEIANMVSLHEKLSVVDHNGRDITAATLQQILYEQACPKVKLKITRQVEPEPLREATGMWLS